MKMAKTKSGFTDNKHRECLESFRAQKNGENSWETFTVITNGFVRGMRKAFFEYMGEGDIIEMCYKPKKGRK